MNRIRQALILVILMLASPWASADIASWDGPIFGPDDAGLNPSNSTYDGYYYYFYDWDFTTSSSCEARTEHNISVNNGGDINRWVCTDDFTCIEVNDGSGQYESLNQCEKNCSATNVSDEKLGFPRIYPNPNVARKRIIKAIKLIT